MNPSFEKLFGLIEKTYSEDPLMISSIKATLTQGLNSIEDVARIMQENVSKEEKESALKSALSNYAFALNVVLGVGMDAEATRARNNKNNMKFYTE